MADPSKIYDHPRSKAARDESDDPSDYSDKYNTKLSQDEEEGYTAWARDHGREKDTADYDMRGAWKAGASEAENGHFPDTYKKPNHPTFSDESKYHGVDGHEGGKWGKKGGRDTFTPGKTNKKMRSKDELRSYFKDREPNADLVEDED